MVERDSKETPISSPLPNHFLRSRAIFVDFVDNKFIFLFI